MSTVQDCQKPFFSVIIPLYNKATHIKRTLDSVLAQTIHDFEIIIVGGKSTDGGEQIVLSYTDSRIKLIQEKGIGVSAARNQGVGEAKADYIAFLDADDEWMSDYLETMSRLIKQYPDAGVYSTGIINFYSKTKQKRQKVHGVDKKYEGVLNTVYYTTAIDRTFPGITSSTVIPKKIFHEMNGFVLGVQVAEDLDLWARICLHYPYVFSANPKIIYHVDAENKLTKDVSTILDTIPPFLNSINSYSNEWLKQNTDYYNLTLYLESLKISVIKRQIVLGHTRKARVGLSEIKHKEFMLKKFCIYFATLLPSSIIPYLVNLYVNRKIPQI